MKKIAYFKTLFHELAQPIIIFVTEKQKNTDL